MKALGNGWDSGTYENGKKGCGEGEELKIQEKDYNDRRRSLRKEGEVGSRGQGEAKTGEGEREIAIVKRGKEKGVNMFVAKFVAKSCVSSFLCDIGEGISACILSEADIKMGLDMQEIYWEKMLVIVQGRESSSKL